MPNVYIKMVWISCEFLIISLTFVEFGMNFDMNLMKTFIQNIESKTIRHLSERINKRNHICYVYMSVNRCVDDGVTNILCAKFIG